VSALGTNGFFDCGSGKAAWRNFYEHILLFQPLRPQREQYRGSDSQAAFLTRSPFEPPPSCSPQRQLFLSSRKKEAAPDMASEAVLFRKIAMGLSLPSAAWEISSVILKSPAGFGV
jgi:hypothetical protein